LPHPVADPRWGGALTERVVWMVRGEVPHAELRLNPPDLGPLEVRITLVEDETRIRFVAPQAVVREAVEAALPRLREMLAATGLNLGHVDVSGQGGGERAPPGPPRAGSAPGARGPAALSQQRVKKPAPARGPAS
jgi:flagellar hook-length control protein FliK